MFKRIQNSTYSSLAAPEVTTYNGLPSCDYYLYDLIALFLELKHALFVKENLPQLLVRLAMTTDFQQKVEMLLHFLKETT